MFQRKVAVFFGIIGIGIILGFISGVAPGYFLKGSFIIYTFKFSYLYVINRLCIVWYWRRIFFLYVSSFDDYSTHI